MVVDMTITDMSLETVVRHLAQVYDLHAGVIRHALPWGAVQLYFASTYPSCSSGDDLQGAEALADTLLHVTLPHAPLHYSENRTCRRLPTSPTRAAEEIVTQGLEARDNRDLPDWYTRNIDDGLDLWTEWRLGPSLPALNNLRSEFGGLCETSWIISPLDLTAPNVPPAATSPFADGPSC